MGEREERKRDKGEIEGEGEEERVSDGCWRSLEVIQALVELGKEGEREEERGRNAYRITGSPWRPPDGQRCRHDLSCGRRASTEGAENAEAGGGPPSSSSK